MFACLPNRHNPMVRLPLYIHHPLPFLCVSIITTASTPSPIFYDLSFIFVSSTYRSSFLYIYLDRQHLPVQLDPRPSQEPFYPSPGPDYPRILHHLSSVFLGLLTISLVVLSTFQLIDNATHTTTIALIQAASGT